MRQAARAKGGFYPAPPEAVEVVAGLLRPPPSGRFAICDPCAGKGAAVGQLAAALGCQPGKVYAIELERQRSEELRAALPEANVLGPCSMFGTSIGLHALSLLWLNPPFDDEIGGGQRTETTFAARAAELLCQGGILAMVVPESTACNDSLRQQLLMWFTDLRVVPFPAECRRFKEVVILGRRRKEFANPSQLYWHRSVNIEQWTYDLPESNGPKRFEKIELTEEELIEYLDQSDLRRHLEPPGPRVRQSPPLELKAGHRALLLASGHLDGLVEPPGEAPHVVRGSAHKVQVVTDCQVEENKGGDTVTKTTLTERIVMSVRVVDHLGHIVTLTQE